MFYLRHQCELSIVKLTALLQYHRRCILYRNSLVQILYIFLYFISGYTHFGMTRTLCTWQSAYTARSWFATQSSVDCTARPCIKLSAPENNNAECLVSSTNYRRRGRWMQQDVLPTRVYDDPPTPPPPPTHHHHPAVNQTAYTVRRPGGCKTDVYKD